MEQLRGRWALVTGASSGLGAEFARALAARGMSLVLVARRRARLDELASELAAKHGTNAVVIALDLAMPEAAACLHEETRARGLDIDVLVNNAGFGLYGYELELDWRREREMLELDIVTLTQLARLYARDMVARGRGHILNVASIAGTQPSPTFASYAAAKAYVISYSHALREELRGTGVSCTVLAPGATDTEFFDVAGSEESLYIQLVKRSAPFVVEAGLRASFRGRAMVIPGVVNRLSVWLTELLPRAWVARLVHFVMKQRSSALPAPAREPAPSAFAANGALALGEGEVEAPSSSPQPS